MPVNDEYLRWVLGQLAGAGAIRTRRMFGAVGLYRDEVFFGIVSANALYFKVSDVNRHEYAARRMAPFRPYPHKPQVSLSYFEVPAEVLEDGEECVRWALAACAAGRAGQQQKHRPK